METIKWIFAGFAMGAWILLALWVSLWWRSYTRSSRCWWLSWEDSR